MKLRLLILAVVCALLTGMALTYVATKDDEVSELTSSQPKTATQARAEQASDRPIRADAYVEYGNEIVEMTPGTKLLFFHAPWCPQCRSLDKDIAAADIPDDVTVIRVDYDTNQDLRKEYGVTIQTTIVKLDENGKFLEKYVAYDQPTFEAVKQNLLR